MTPYLPVHENADVPDPKAVVEVDAPGELLPPVRSFGWKAACRKS